MNENTDFFQEDIPSRHINILDKIKNSKVVKLVRYSSIFPEKAERYNTSASLLFCVTVGPLLMTLDSGLIVGFAYLPRTSSVSLWTEQTEEGQRGNIIPSTQEDPEMFPIDCCDPNYGQPPICEIIGQQIIGIKIVKRENPSQNRLNRLPREGGLIFELESGFELILSNGLDGYSGTFHIIYRQEVSPRYPEILQEIPI